MREMFRLRAGNFKSGIPSGKIMNEVDAQGKFLISSGPRIAWLH